MNPIYTVIMGLLHTDSEVAASDLMHKLNRRIGDGQEKYKPPGFTLLMSGMESAGLVCGRNDTVPGTTITARYYKKSGEVEVLNGIFSVSHFHMITDRLWPTQTLVMAKDAEEALKKYNALARKREGFPYFWGQQTIESVHPATAIL